jgi:hypothetical protein
MFGVRQAQSKRYAQGVIYCHIPTIFGSTSLGKGRRYGTPVGSGLPYISMINNIYIYTTSSIYIYY